MDEKTQPVGQAAPQSAHAPRRSKAGRPRKSARELGRVEARMPVDDLAKAKAKAAELGMTPGDLFSLCTCMVMGLPLPDYLERSLQEARSRQDVAVDPLMERLAS